MDKQFEELCRAIAEKVICPNLLPQTGPTGGGDSKVDSETYPVSEHLSELWYSGMPSNASAERWAFAISAKKDWKAKVKSDVKKIVGVNQDQQRDYKKIYFMSNQCISDKKRADCEDELRKEYSIDVRILDRTWILEQIFSSQANIDVAVKRLGLSESLLDEIEVGEKDYSRKKQLENLEERLKCPDLKKSEKVKLVSDAVILARELEKSEDEVLGLIDRCIRISKKYGNRIDIASSYSLAAWTIYWWYQNPDSYYQYYVEYERLTLKEHNVHLYNELIALWINLFSLVQEKKGEFDLEYHRKAIIDEYEKYINDDSKPNTALEARAAYVPFRIINGENVETVIDEMFALLDERTGHIDLDISSIKKLILEFPTVLESARYNELFEKLISVSGESKRNTETAIMMVQRADMLRDENPYDAISYYSRAIMPFFNEENKDNLSKVIFSLAEQYEKCGLHWAARNFYYYVFCVCLNQYFKFGDVSPLLFISAERLKYIELQLGHILYSTEFYVLERISRNIYPDSIVNDDELELRYDMAVAILLLQTEKGGISYIKKLPGYLKNNNLNIASIVAKYLLGSYDSKFLEEMNNDTNEYDSLMASWKNSSATEDILAQPWYGGEDNCKLSSYILGCEIEVVAKRPYVHGEIEISATLLASIESFLGTGINNDLISMCSHITIQLEYETNLEQYITWRKSSSDKIIVSFREYSTEEFLSVQNQFSVFLTELIGALISIMFPYAKALQKIESMIRKEAALDRTFIFSNSIFFGMETMGKDSFLYEHLLENCSEFSCEQDITIPKKEKDVTTGKPIKISMDPPPVKTITKNISNRNIKTYSILDLDNWDKGKWRGIMFKADIQNHSFLPILALIFENDEGCNIFKKWISTFGSSDINDDISIRIIKGIDTENPFHYRVIIGTERIPTDSKIRLLASPSRVQTMMPTNNKHIMMFENELKKSDGFGICPAVIKAGRVEIFEDLIISKSKSSIKICDAHEIPENDLLFISGILPTDKPIIPDGIKNPAILKIIEMHKRFN